MRLVFAVPAGSASFAKKVWVNGQGRGRSIQSRPSAAASIPTRQGPLWAYDNAHGTHERHFMGEVSPVPFRGYPATSQTFSQEAERHQEKL